MKHARALRVLVRVLGLRRRAWACGIPAPVALRAGDAVLVKQADVEPHGRVERTVLMEAEPGQLAVEAFAVGGAGEVAVFEAPIGDRAGDAVDELLDAVLALGRADFAVEVLAADDVRRELAPERRHFAVGLLEDQFAVLALDLRRCELPNRRWRRDRRRRSGRIGRRPSAGRGTFWKWFGSLWKKRHGLNISGRHLGTSCAWKSGHPTYVNICTHCYQID